MARKGSVTRRGRPAARHHANVQSRPRIQKAIDVLGWLDGPVFEPLKDPTSVTRFYVDGGTVAAN